MASQTIQMGVSRRITEPIALRLRNLAKSPGNHNYFLSKGLELVASEPDKGERDIRDIYHFDGSTVVINLDKSNDRVSLQVYCEPELKDKRRGQFIALAYDLVRV